MKMMPSDVISHENQLQHLSEPSIFMLDVFRTADHAGQIFIPHRYAFSGIQRGKLFLVSDFPQKMLLVDDLFCFFPIFSFITHLLFDYSTFLLLILFNCQFSVASLTSLRYTKIFLTLPERSRYASKLFLQTIHSNNFFTSLQKRCRYAVPART